jgi:hypothetical protein
VLEKFHKSAKIQIIELALMFLQTAKKFFVKHLSVSESGVEFPLGRTIGEGIARGFCLF